MRAAAVTWAVTVRCGRTAQSGALGDVCRALGICSGCPEATVSVCGTSLKAGRVAGF
ncbi:hypothetical protein [Streptomyces sp. MBT62]|uniref:hypothetical protein n=1 Tax=Streptomyces sp. MBT62 TaxID=2800410 RepID=UPI0019096C3D|nr:hypothetical protein [Streptomyces sp. MBT62]MBK3563818.1 hypothetical protein [Streptomyces sp. MBT62]